MYFKQIDSVRFLLVFLVLVSHWLGSLPFIEHLRLGAIGVEFFFIISGFLISLQLFGYKEAINNKTLTFKKSISIFYLRRTLRIFPLYYFVVILATIFNRSEIRDALFWNLSYTTNFYFIKVQHWPGIFSHFWTLAVEEHFYLFWPFILLFFNRRYLIFIFFLIIVFSVSFRYLSFRNSFDYFTVYLHTFSCLDLFMMGALLAYLYKYKTTSYKKIFASKSLKAVTFFSFLILYFIWFTKPEWIIFNWVFQRLFLGLVYMLTLGFLVLGIKGPIGLFLENKFLIRLGKISYAIYLIHNFVPGILLPIKNLELHIIPEFFIYLIATIIGSEVLYRLIENPIRSLNKRFIIKQQTD